MRIALVLVGMMAACGSSGREVRLEAWPAWDGGVVVASTVEEDWLAPLDEDVEPELEEATYGLQLKRAVVVERLPADVRAMLGTEVELFDADERTCAGRLSAFEVVATSAYAAEVLHQEQMFGDPDDPETGSLARQRGPVWNNDPVLVARVDGECSEGAFFASVPGRGRALASDVPPPALADEIVAVVRGHGFFEVQELDYRDAVEGARMDAKRQRDAGVPEDEIIDRSEHAPATWDYEPPQVTSYVDAQGRTRAALVQLGHHFACAVPPAWFVVVIDGDTASVSHFGVGRAPAGVALIGDALRVLDRDGDAVEIMAPDGEVVMHVRTIERGAVECDVWGDGIPAR